MFHTYEREFQFIHFLQMCLLAWNWYASPMLRDTRKSHSNINSLGSAQ